MKPIKLPAVLLALLMLMLTPITVRALPQDTRVPGGVVVLPLNPSDVGTGNAPPVVRYQDMRVATVKDGANWLALIGLSLQTKPGQHSVSVNGIERSFYVSSKKYPEERLTISNKRQVTPNPEDLARIKSDQQEIAHIKALFSDNQPDTNFSPPTAGAMSSRFGLKRYFNGHARNPHSGLDFRGGTGQPVVAPAAGKIVKTGMTFFGGNTVFVDHGQGLISLYMHLSRIDVHEGDTVKRGDSLGAIGATGRATGPHLHWTVYLNTAMVDPELFLTSR